MEIIVARIKNRNLVELHEVYRVDKGFPTRVKYYGYWTPENGLVASKETLYDRRFDLEGKILKTGSTEVIKWGAMIGDLALAPKCVFLLPKISEEIKKNLRSSICSE